MNEPIAIQEQDAILRGLAEAVAARRQAVAQLQAAQTAAVGAAQAELEAAQQRAAVEYQAAMRREQAEVTQAQARLQSEFDGSYQPLEQEYQGFLEKLRARDAAEKAKAKKARDEARWETTTVFDATKHKPKRELAEAERQVNLRAERLVVIANDAKVYLNSCKMLREPQIDSENPTPIEADPLKQFVDTLAAAEEQLLALVDLGLPRLFRGGAYLWIFAGLGLLAAIPAGLLLQDQPAMIAVSVAAAFVGAALICGWLYFQARNTAHEHYDQLCRLLFDAESARSAWHDQAVAKSQRELAEIKQKHENDLRRAADTYESAKQTALQFRTQHHETLQKKYPPRLAELKAQFESGTKGLASQHEQRVAELGRKRSERLREVKAEFERRAAELQAADQSGWQQIGDRWRAQVRACHETANRLRERMQTHFPDWHTADLNNWKPSEQVDGAIRIGEFTVNLAQLPEGLSDDPRLKLDVPPVLQIPAMLSLPERGSLVLKVAGSAARAQAIDTLQAVMLRYLGAIPPGKIRFTIIDPVGLGQNFAGFMHLADYDEALVSHKIWTEPPHIEQRLSDLTSHMSNVIQKYLRNEFDTIEDYNQHAGEVAEPYRVLVVANFPFNFTEAAMRHLLSIAGTGTRCGVYVLVSVDTRLSLPQGFRIGDLEQHAIKLVWREEGTIWREPKFEKYPLKLDSPPSSDRFSKLVHLAGEGAKNASRVEVPFDFIAPPPDQYWTWSSATGIDVPLGRAGATKRQNLKLGRGTAQHVLIAGKTGSGKSTLLHALITNLALMYTPDEVELYLIDFKKGVEFKTYAEYELPHARVIAIESEREFGLSVLQRLDAELKQRGERFRDTNVQDLNGFRQAQPGVPMPRLLLIVDEFQEFFVEDDKIAQDVSLLLDRLVRQGRAFGIHVHLGSQTLGGAYGLARATLGQMAVRIALQCSEADANLILSEENSAARLLSRPGEAIYNDANGRVEGNNLFQVVFLTDDRREAYLNRVREMAKERHLVLPPQIVFEGNVPAEIQKNALLHDLIAAPAWSSVAGAPQAWLGEAIAIKDPTALAFRRQSGASAIMIGQQAEATLAIMIISIVSLAAQHPPGADSPSARFYVLDGSPPDALHVGRLAKLSTVVPQPFDVGGPRDAGRIVGELAAELKRRQEGNEVDAPPLYLFIYDLPRYRDLRKADDDFGFSRGEEKPNPAKQLVTLLREGPGLGIHVICWCDTLNNVHRMFERQTMREFDSRIIFQMSASDSSTLIDSPAASRLGPHRALLHQEELGISEKFRPYALPDEAWLAWVGSQLRGRTPAGEQPASAELTPLG